MTGRTTIDFTTSTVLPVGSGTGRLRVSPKIGEEENGGDIKGPDVVNLRDQTTGPDPLSFMRALLTGEASAI